MRLQLIVLGFALTAFAEPATAQQPLATPKGRPPQFATVGEIDRTNAQLTLLVPVERPVVRTQQVTVKVERNGQFVDEVRAVEVVQMILEMRGVKFQLTDNPLSATD